jgi:hypothetical protein
MCSVIGDRRGAWIVSFVLEFQGSFDCHPDKFALFKMGLFVFHII